MRDPKKSRKFVTLGMRERPPEGSRNQVFLERNGWNDYGFAVLWNVHVTDSEANLHSVGSVRIGAFDLGDARTAALPEEFNELSDEYFSLGVDETYYSELTALGDELRDTVLGGLRDCAKNLDVFDQACNENVTKTALMRSVTASTVRGQFHRMAHGGARLSPYEFTFENPFIDSRGNVQSSVRLQFRVVPESTPPSNVHVIIGRNGIGKSFLLNNITNVLVRPEIPTSGEIEFLESADRTLPSKFSRVVSVAFSAFDEFVPPQAGTNAPGSLTYDYIGLRLVDPSRPNALKTSPALAKEFGTSVQNCLDGPRLARWRRALEILESDPLFAELSVANLADTERESDDVRAAARKLFKSLSSGHKIVLLTVTRLVETVEEATLVLLDEPEGHLHPPLLAAFLRALSDLLEHRNGVAIVATHSPVVLQEVPAMCVWKIRRSGWNVLAERPVMETFGENVGILTQEVFGLEVAASGFYRTLSEAARSGRTYEELVEEFKGQLGGEARALLRALVLSRRE